ncbi:DEKNAAC100070 [Brettanomyces naardenensis]|uniref:DEKNAAC100070 n=1 Tax=Brettanomyces naardenensis TaxID=13370 RepID=A0A448YFV8_BRENA|nr:DEKNAAC100070 [Brettanomyces naardenensis]
MASETPQPPLVWNHTPETILSETDRLIKEGRALDDQIAAIKLDEATVDNVLKPYADLENRQAALTNQLSFYQHVSPSKEVRTSSNKADAKFRAFSIESGLREDVFKVVHKVFEDIEKNPDLAKEPETKRFIEKVNRQYERNGLGLPAETRAKVKELQQKLAELSLEFSKNLGENTEYILLTKDQLAGVPADVVSQFEKVEDKYKMTFKYPDLFPVLKYASDPETRKAAFIGDQNKAPENADILIEAVKLRAQLAKLLGYKNYSEYVLDDRMAKTPETVMTFLTDLKGKLRLLGENELELLKKLKTADLKEKHLKPDDNYYVWDHRYYHTMMLEKDYEVDESKIAEYFPMQNTIQKMLSIYETIFNLKFVEITNDSKLYNTWHDEVKQFAVWKVDDKETPEFVGYLYFDLHSRPGKYGHAANFGLAPGYTDEKTGIRVYPSTSLVCNFTRDTKDKPSLLKHDEVVTFFHELGHGIHDLLGKTRYSRFSGTSVHWDFVEMPSQFLENFCWDHSILKRLSSHYVSHEPLPDSLIGSLTRSKNVNGALFNLRQLHFGLFDMALHTSDDGEVDMYKLWNDTREKVALVSNGGVNTKGFGSFGHLMGGYASGYYGYLWSQVFAQDIYYTKFKKDPLNVKSGLEYRDKILARGGSGEELDYLSDLLGREPNSNAFLKELGISN